MDPRPISLGVHLGFILTIDLVQRGGLPRIFGLKLPTQAIMDEFPSVDSALRKTFDLHNVGVDPLTPCIIAQSLSLMVLVLEYISVEIFGWLSLYQLTS